MDIRYIMSKAHDEEHNLIYVKWIMKIAKSMLQQN